MNKTVILLVVMTTLASVGPAGQDPYRLAAVDAARWITTSAVATKEGVFWPSAPGEKTKPPDTTLYTGTPGPILLFLELHRLTGDAGYLQSARAGADALLASLPAGTGTGLYEGIAGAGFTLGQASLITRDPKYRAGALQSVQLLQSRAKEIGRGVEWNDVTDIISGTSGTGLFLLWADRELKASGARELATRAGRRLLERGEQRADGTRKWMMDAKFPREMPNFSHGTAGVAYFLATLYQDTGEEEFLNAALAGANYLLSIADTEGDACIIYHNDTAEGRKLYYLSWCHGPAGTARLFYRLHQVTKDPKWLSWFLKSARAVVATGGPERVVSPGEWDNVSMCCGITGQAQFFLNVYDVTKDKTYFDLAHRATELLLSKGTRDAHGLSWTQAEHRVQPELRVAQTGYMQGASGMGMWLLHLSLFTEGEARPMIVFPDSPFRY